MTTIPDHGLIADGLQVPLDEAVTIAALIGVCILFCNPFSLSQRPQYRRYTRRTRRVLTSTAPGYCRATRISSGRWRSKYFALQVRDHCRNGDRKVLPNADI